MVPGRDTFQGENGEECVVELELAEKHYCKLQLFADGNMQEYLF